MVLLKSDTWPLPIPLLHWFLVNKTVKYKWSDKTLSATHMPDKRQKQKQMRNQKKLYLYINQGIFLSLLEWCYNFHCLNIPSQVIASWMHRLEKNWSMYLWVFLVKENKLLCVDKIPFLLFKFSYFNQSSGMLSMWIPEKRVWLLLF